MKARKTLVGLTTLALFVAACGGSESQKKGDEIDISDRKINEEAADALLDDTSDVIPPKPLAATEVQRLELPPTPTEPKFEIDGSGKDWKGVKKRKFNKRGSIESGVAYWKGGNDASFSVAVDSDTAFFYMLIEVRDDKLLTQGEEESDGIVLTLRDPNLDAFVKLLPDGSRLQERVKTETQLLILPDGRFRRFAVDRPLPDDMGIIAVEQTKRGYTLEMALQVEALEQVSSIPVYDLAFRIDLLDGDEADRPGTQTVLSMFPDLGNDEPRLALVELEGVLPHYDVAKIPPRKNAIGAWSVTEEKNWEFSPFEAVPERWATVEDRKAFEKAIQEIDAFDEVCKRSRKELQLVEAYQSRGGGQRVGLILCGDRTRGSGKKTQCPAGAKTEVIWVQMISAEDGWIIKRAENIFGKKLPQCAWKGITGEPFVSRLSLFPVDMQDPNMWAVGWTRTTQDVAFREDVNGITLLQSQRRKPVIGTALTNETRATSESRTRLSAKVYLTPVDKDEHFDFCQIEDVEEQYCEGLDRGCKTHEHGKTVLTTIQLYRPKVKVFERYEMSKHKGCTADFDFAKREGYILMQTRGRVGFLPSPITQAANSDNLDLF